MYLANFPRYFLAHLPTPIEKLERLTKKLGGAQIWIKRDDCTGLSTGGNKTRKLEFLMAQAKEQKADTIVTQGAIQSNHARQTAAFAAKLAMRCHILLEDRTGSKDHNYNNNANVLLDHLHGATTEKYPSGADLNAEIEIVAEKMRALGRNVYTIPGGGSNPIGALGYVNCAFEIIQQVNDMRLNLDYIVHASGSAGTQAGLAAGLTAMNVDINLLGIGVNAPKDIQEQKVYELACLSAAKIRCDTIVKPQNVIVNADYVGEAYGVPTPACLEAIRLFAELEGILLDPVYSAKAAAGLIDLIRKGYFDKTDTILFIHTGGAVALFAYDSAFDFSSRWLKAESLS